MAIGIFLTGVPTDYLPVGLDGLNKTMKYILIIIEITLLIYIAYTGFMVVQYLGELNCQDYSSLSNLIARQKQVIENQTEEIIDLTNDLMGI